MGNTGSRKASMSAMDGGMREKKVKAELCNLSKTRRLQAWEQGERQRKHHARDEHHAWEDLVHNVNAVWSERVVAGLDKALDDVMTIGGCMPQSRTPDSARDKVVPAETRNLRGVHSHRAHKFTDGRKEHRGSNAGNSDRRVGQQAPRPNDALGTDIDIREAAVVDGDDRVLLADGDDRVLLAEEAKRKKGAAAGVPAIRRVKSTVRNMIAEVKEREEKTRMHEMAEHKKETMIRRRTNALKGLHINVKFANSHDEQDGPASVTSPSA
jgi:hypothetical protein